MNTPTLPTTTRSKCETLVEMLYRYREAQETLIHSGEGSGGHVPQMPLTWNSSFRELERCLHLLSEERPKQTRMLLARYVDATQTRKRLHGRRDGKGVLHFSPGSHAEVRTCAQLADSDRGVNEWDCVVLAWPSWVKNQLVREALDRLEQVFRGEPYLAVEMTELRAA